MALLRPSAGDPALSAHITQLIDVLQGARTDGALYPFFEPGALGAPALRPRNDVDTGIWWPANGKMAVQINAAEYAGWDWNGNFVMGNVEGSAITGVTTTTTGGWLWIRSSAGPPTGVPDPDYTNRVPLHWDRTNHRLYVRSGGVWKMIQAS